MFANPKSLVVLVATSILAVQAQGTETSSAASSTPSLSACLLQCVTSAAQSAGCSGFTDLACVCSSVSFQTAAAQCLQASCTAEDLQTGLALAQQECGGVATTSGGSESTGASTTTPTGATSSGTSATTTPTAPGTTITTPTGTTTTPTSHTTTTTTSSKTSTTGTSTATSSSAAVGLVPFAFGGFFGTLVASAGALVSAALVL
ncbi:hypothetical protein SCLCIDRAFT_8461 [Scleroderma citrinum Foug A]|uniref:CFEM domain-containing protein n=1 Tax=Scleroderma citrinum Foug A TaxID=1036808 RepID=A0A0C3AIC5_9AGAM|nr:hypothetical protein SCLCIDRAFT_8461 [Scleroderma citrinum Foug A]